MEVVDPAGKRVVMFGAGGAARAIAVELALAGAASITVVNRGEERGAGAGRPPQREDKAKADLVVWEGDYKVPEGTDIVVNATSIGLYPDLEARLALDVSTLKPGMVVADVIANPPKLRLIRDAEAHGCKAISGRGMLVNQGVIGIKYWTGVDVDPAVMQEELARIFDA